MTHYTVRFNGEPPDTWAACLRETKAFWEAERYDKIMGNILHSADQFLSDPSLIDYRAEAFIDGVELAVSFGGVSGLPGRVLGAVCLLALEGGPKYRYKGGLPA